MNTFKRLFDRVCSVTIFFFVFFGFICTKGIGGCVACELMCCVLVAGKTAVCVT